MADNTTLNAGAGGDVIATDDIGGVKHPLVKVEFGAPDSATPVSAVNPLPVKPLVGGDVVTTLAHGRKTVITAGTPVALVVSATPCKWVMITALHGNTQIVAVGASGVVANPPSSRVGIPLEPGDSVTFPVDDVAKVFLDSVISGEGVSFLHGA